MALPLRWFSRRKYEFQIHKLPKLTRLEFVRFYCVPQPKEFRVLSILPKYKEQKDVIPKKPGIQINQTPRTTKMSEDQDWTNVWPGPKTFHPASVPLPIRQGYNKYGAPPGKVANAELMKIPNFLHLTEPAIEKHCKALKQFCTDWPEELKTVEDMEKHFPIEVISSDYCHSSPSIRNPLSRIISIRVKLKNLKLNKHAKDKLLRLVGERYDKETDYITITTDACPLKKQNYDYAHYLLTALYFESWKFENWETEKGDEDMEEYIFWSRKSKENIVNLFKYNKRKHPKLTMLGSAVEKWNNEGDDPQVIGEYKAAVLDILSLPPFEEEVTGE